MGGGRAGEFCNFFCCVSNDRLHKENVCITLKNVDIKTLPHRKGFAGVEL